MNFYSSAVVSMLIASASAFVPHQQSAVNSRSVSVVAMSDASVELEGINKNRIQPGRYDDKPTSIAIPFLKRPTQLDGTHAGDYGFDPLGFTESYDLYTMQESELRHGRLAMLAVVGWPLSELLGPKWMLQENGCAPSVLNGFNPISLVATALFFGAAGFFEFKTSLRCVVDKPLGKTHVEDMGDIWKYGVAGDYNFDPLGLYSSIGNDAVSRKGLRDVEVSHGRSAMLGITSFVIWEFLTKHPIVENSMFFHPNLLLPALYAGYVGITSVYDIEFFENNRSASLRITSEGQAKLENAKMGLGINGPVEIPGSALAKDENFQRATESLVSAINTLGEKVVAPVAEKVAEKAAPYVSEISDKVAEKTGPIMDKVTEKTDSVKDLIDEKRKQL